MQPGQENFKIGFKTDIGRKRSQNQDSFAVVPDLGLFVVADGMGGHRGGEIASSMVAQAVPEVIRGVLQSASQWDPRTLLADSIRTANERIFQRACTTPVLQGMGTTTTALLFKDNLLTIGHVGDSRCYFFRPKMMWQATRDHSLVQEKLRAGLITRDEIKTDRMKNVITRSVGFEREVNVEMYQMVTQPGDVFLICSDGLSGLMSDEDINEIIQNQVMNHDDIEKAVELLIARANANGGDDNITSIVIQVQQSENRES